MISPRGSFLLPLPNRPALVLGDRTLVMGVLNVTPDSFSDGGEAFDPDRAVDRALAMEADGADLIDVGAESTRPGAEPVDAAEEWRRLGPVLTGLVRRLGVPISIDTYRARTAQRALDEGVAIVNDISGLGYDAGLGAIVAARGAALILMHTRGRPRDMYVEACYDDVVAEVVRELQLSMERAIGHGVTRDRLVIDPGFGFAKRADHSMTALAHFASFAALGRPLLSGPSRKSFLTSATGPLPPQDRDWATAAAITASVLAGAHIVRVHRVREMAQVVRVADALRQAGAP
ncbi:MAG TPA: dihydropteroate synthase [Vicinamibacterales bacterium]|nr:dihydropteroate synthase [Vicinamibacterales bacterium]